MRERAKIMLAFGTRPEAIKMAPLCKYLEVMTQFNTQIVVTAQHREMLDTVLSLFDIKPTYDLDLMSPNQTITDITTRVLKGMGKILEIEKPNLLVVHGDTTTTFAAALAGYYNQIPVGHVEAGLRSGNIYSPYPEEMNRILADAISEIHFAPTDGNKNNLINSGVKKERIYVTGNTVIDALHMVVKDNYIFKEPSLNIIDYLNNKVILLTSHRRENWGKGMEKIFYAVKSIIQSNSEVIFIFPVHPNPLIRDLAYKILGSNKRIHLIEPLDYVQFANLMSRVYMIMTDSGGIQEEAPSLGKPVLVLRTETERPEAVLAGTVKVVGVEPENVVKEVELMINNTYLYQKMANAVNPYGDGKASKRITEAISNWLKLQGYHMN